MLDLSRMMVEEERYRDRVRQIERDRFARAVASNNQEQTRFYGQLLAGLGRSLTAWGLRLQARYGAMVETPSQYCQPSVAGR